MAKPDSIDRFANFLSLFLSTEDDNSGRWRRWVLLLGIITLIMVGVGIYWSQEPAPVVIPAKTEKTVVGQATTDALIQTLELLLTKPGGYLSNDITPPSVMMDNMPNWEFGVVKQARDLTRALRDDMSRSQTQSVEDPDLAEADPNLSFDHNSWIFPATESKYGEAIDHIKRYRTRLVDPKEKGAQFYARSDNLSYWLELVERRLGNLSQRLSAAVGQKRINTDLANDRSAEQATPTDKEQIVKTPWLEIDNIFYEARGSAWALLIYLRAVESDFAGVLADKNAQASLQQIIRELESAIKPLQSPMILNGGGYGFFANHSLVMASYISKANAALSDLRRLLADG